MSPLDKFFKLIREIDEQSDLFYDKVACCGPQGIDKPPPRLDVAIAACLPQLEKALEILKAEHVRVADYIDKNSPPT